MPPNLPNMHNQDHQRSREAVDREMTDDIVGLYQGTSAGYWLLVIVLAVVTILGIIGLGIRVSAGFPNTEAWGYYAATFAFLFATVMGAPIIVAGLHFTKALWPRPLNRIALTYAISGVVWGLMFLPLLATMPETANRATIWFGASMAVVKWADAIAVWMLVTIALTMLFVMGRPDWAVIRDQTDGRRRSLARRLAGNWTGTIRQWVMLQKGFGVLAALYLVHYLFAATIISSDFGMSLVPGWRSANFPPYHAITAAQAGIATIIVTMALHRRFGGLRRYLGLSQFWALGKMQLALTLLWFYFFWSEFIVIWYGRTTREINLLQILGFGPYFTPFVIGVFFLFLLPFALLIWNPIRKSIAGPTLTAVSILIGIFFDRIRLYVPAFQIAGSGKGGAITGELPTARWPDGVDVLMMAGALAAVALVYLLAIKLVTPISIWQVKLVNMLREERPFLRTEVEVIGKPE